MSRRGSRVSRRPLASAGGYDGKLSSTTFATLPSGVTIDQKGIPVFGAGGVTIAKVDFGQGTQYKFFRGSSGITGTLGFDPSISAGTAQIDTGLTDVLNFSWNKRLPPGATPTSTGATALDNLGISVKYGHLEGSGVTLVLLDGSNAGVTPGSSLMTDCSGCSIDWIVIGT